MTDDAALLGLMRLASPALPVGGFAYSQGLENAIDVGWVCDGKGVESWLRGVLGEGLARLDVPLLARLVDASENATAFEKWNDRVFASRESRELRLEEEQMGKALWRLLRDLEIPLPGLARPSWLASFAVAGRYWGLSRRQICLGFLWSWLENQLVVAAKTVPIGQTDVQRITSRMLVDISDAIETGLLVENDQISGGLPGMIMASMKHETQYSRLFRS